MAGGRVAVEGSGCRPSGGRGGGALLASAMETCCSHAEGMLKVPGSCVGTGALEAVVAAAAELAALGAAGGRGQGLCYTDCLGVCPGAQLFYTSHGHQLMILRRRWFPHFTLVTTQPCVVGSRRRSWHVDEVQGADHVSICEHLIVIPL